MNWRIELSPIEVAEYQWLRNSTNWNKLPDATVAAGLKRDLFSVKVYAEKQLVGMARVIGDGAIYFYIQDVIVLPQYQNQGIGHLLMQEVEKYLTKNTTTHSFIGLMAASNVEGFYQQYGYSRRSEDAPGMYKIITKKPDQ